MCACVYHLLLAFLRCRLLNIFMLHYEEILGQPSRLIEFRKLFFELKHWFRVTLRVLGANVRNPSVSTFHVVQAYKLSLSRSWGFGPNDAGWTQGSLLENRKAAFLGPKSPLHNRLHRYFEPTQWVIGASSYWSCEIIAWSSVGNRWSRSWESAGSCCEFVVLSWSGELELKGAAVLVCNKDPYFCQISPCVQPASWCSALHDKPVCLFPVCSSCLVIFVLCWLPCLL